MATTFSLKQRETRTSHGPIPHPLTQDNSLRSRKVRDQVARLLILNGIVFFNYQIPLRIASIHNISKETFNSPFFTSMQYGIIIVIGRTLLFLNSAVNPLICIASSSFYRKAVFEAVFNSKFGDESYADASNSTGGQKKNSVSIGRLWL